MEIIEILKSNIDFILKEFKALKQKILKKMCKKENFWKIKEDFLKSQSCLIKDVKLSNKFVNIPNNLKIKNEFKRDFSDESFKKNTNTTISEHENSSSEDKYRESSVSMELLKEADKKDLEKTKQILYELSDMMTNFSSKIKEHQQMTQTSKLNE